MTYIFDVISDRITDSITDGIFRRIAARAPRLRQPLRRTLTVGVAAMKLAACGDAAGPVAPPPAAPVTPVVSVEVAPGTHAMLIGGSIRLAATPRAAGGAPLIDRPVQWASSNVEVASVSADGLVTAHRRGVAYIEAVADGRKGVARIDILSPSPMPGVYRLQSVDAAALPALLSEVYWMEDGAIRTVRAMAAAGALDLGSDYRYTQTLSVEVYRFGQFHYSHVWEDAGDYRIEGPTVTFTSAMHPERVLTALRGDGTLDVTERLPGEPYSHQFHYARNWIDPNDG